MVFFIRRMWAEARFVYQTKGFKRNEQYLIRRMDQTIWTIPIRRYEFAYQMQDIVCLLDPKNKNFMKSQNQNTEKTKMNSKSSNIYFSIFKLVHTKWLTNENLKWGLYRHKKVETISDNFSEDLYDPQTTTICLYNNPQITDEKDKTHQKKLNF